MTLRDIDYFLTDGNEEAFNALTTEQLDLLSSGGTIEVADEDDPKDEDKDDPKDEDKDDPKDEDKDDSRLAEAEKRATEAEAALAQSQQQLKLLEELKAAHVEDKGTGETKAQDEVVAKLKEDFPELADGIARMVEATQAEFKRQLAEIQAAMQAQVAPLQQAAQESAAKAHEEAIRAAVPDYLDIIKSGELDKWKNAQPSYVRAAIENVMNQGTASEVVEMFTQFKASKGVPPTKAELASAVKDSKPKAAGVVQTLSDVPSASTPQNSKEPETAEEWQKAFEGKSQREILDLL